MKIRVFALAVAMVALLSGLAFAGGQTEKKTTGGPAIPTIPQVQVSFGHEPYIDHTEAIIGIRKGWFKDVGITITPTDGRVVPNENFTGILSSGQLDVLSGSAVLVMPAIKQVPPFKNFVNGDMFQGYALMAQPNAGYKSVQDFVAEGKSPIAAIHDAVQQMKGNRFAYPPEAAIKGFINLALDKGGLTLNDVKSIVAEDAKTNALMIGNQADFQVGGVPSRLTLESNGFKPIITSFDLARFAKPSADSTELRAVFHDGWLALDSWIDKNHDTMLRMSSVLFRILQFMNDHQQEAITIQLPFVNSAAGTNITPAQAKVAYESLDPFLPFSKQGVWYTDTTSSLNYDYVTGSFINMYQEQGVFKPGEVKVSDVSIASEVYKQFLDMKSKSDANITEAKSLIAAAKSGVDMSQAKDLLAKSQTYYDDFDYLDSMGFSQAAIEWAKYAASK